MAGLAALAPWSCAPAARRPTAPAPYVTDAVVVGAVRSDRALLWARCSGPAALRFTLERADAAGERLVAPAPRLPVAPGADFVGKREVTGLEPATAYVVHAACAAPGDDGGAPDAGSVARFRTAPAADDPAPVRFAWSGDLGGQNVCRDRDEGYPVFDPIRGAAPDFFIGLGDMIYADSPCLDVGRYGNAQIPGPALRPDLASYRSVWSYNRADPAFRRLLAAVPYEAVWDDHEVLNDFGPSNDVAFTGPLASGVHLLPIGREAFVEWNPLPASDGDARFYRSARWGKHLEVFYLDTRSYRDANSATDTDAAPKSLLGEEQRSWLLEAVRASDATWQVFVTSVPLSLVTGKPDAHDSFASGGSELGFERELVSLLRGLRAAGATTPVFITTDVHFQYVARLTPLPEAPEFHVYEIAVGPLNAGLVPPSVSDPRLRPEVLYANGPARPDTLGWQEAKRWFNFGVVAIDADGRLRLSVVDATGAVRYELELAAPRQQSALRPPGARRPRSGRACSGCAARRAPGARR